MAGFHYEWRILLEGGVLSKPGPVGRYYEEKELINSYNTPEDAVKDLEEVYSEQSWGPPTMVLITIYASD